MTDVAACVLDVPIFASGGFQDSRTSERFL